MNCSVFLGIALAGALQLSVYADALARATGRSVVEAWIVLPVAAGAIQVTARDE